MSKNQEINKNLLEILACPLCKGNLEYNKKENELICFESKLAFKVVDGIPQMLIDEARKLD
ncbi:MAG: Trm112 family protein [Pelagibacterales bacterium]|nr:Trm112 family protein [Pelagibacterales bacterium]